MPANDHDCGSGSRIGKWVGVALSPWAASSATAGRLAPAIPAKSARPAMRAMRKAAFGIASGLRRGGMAAVFAEHRLGDTRRQRFRPLDDADHRQHDQEVDEVPRGEDARRDHRAAFRRLRAEIAEAEADEDEDPE